MNVIQFFLILKAQRKVFWVTLLSTILLVVVLDLVLPKKYTATAAVVINGTYTDPVTSMQMQGELLPGYLATQADIIASHSTALRVVDALGLTKDTEIQSDFKSDTAGQGAIRDWIANQLLLKYLIVMPSRESNVIEISFPAPDPESSMLITNAFVDAYIATSVDLKAQPAKQIAQWYTGRLTELKNNLLNAQNKLGEYQKTHDVVLGGQIDTESAKLEAIVAQQVITQAQSFSSASKSQHAGNDLADVMNNPVVQTINSSLIESEAKLNQLVSTDGINNPEYQSRLAEVNELKQKLSNQIALAKQSVKTGAGVDRQSEVAMRAAVSTEEQNMLAHKTTQDQGALLLNDVLDAQKMYDAAMQSFRQSELQSKTDQTDIAVLNRAAVPNKYSSPKDVRNIILAILLGGFLGVNFSLIAEMRNRRVRTPSDIIEGLALPLLGIIVSSGKNMSEKRSWFARKDRALLQNRSPKFTELE